MSVGEVGGMECSMEKRGGKGEVVDRRARPESCQANRTRIGAQFLSLMSFVTALRTFATKIPLTTGKGNCLAKAREKTQMTARRTDFNIFEKV